MAFFIDQGKLGFCRALRRSSLAAAALLTMVGAAPTVPSGPVEAYVRAVNAMRALPQPAFATYSTGFESSGNMWFAVQRAKTGYASFLLTMGGHDSAPHTFITRVRASDHRRVVLINGVPAIARTPLFDMTWNGVYDWLRFGLSGEAYDPGALSSHATPAPEPRVTTEPEPANSSNLAAPGAAATELPIIGGAVIFGSQFYTISDAGERACGDGRLGRRLALRAKTDAQRHPLTEIVLDDQGRMCIVHFGLHQRGPASLTGDIELSFAPIGGYWLVSNGVADFSAHLLGIRAAHNHLTFHYDNPDFPNTLPDTAFDPPTPTANP